MRKEIKKIAFISYTRLDYSLNSVLIKGLNENGIRVLGFHTNERWFVGLKRVYDFYKKIADNIDVVIIGYNSPALVPFFHLLYRKKIIYNSVLSEYERIIVSRNLTSRFSIKAIYYWLIDFIAVHSANLTLVESNHQAEYFSKMFLLPRNRITRSWIGVNEDLFYFDKSIIKAQIFTVIFKGSILPETGAEYFIRAAKLLEREKIHFIMQTGGQMLDNAKKLIKKLKLKNIETRSGYVSIDELRSAMQQSHINIGQLSSHPRLNRTLPHKSYESLILKIPYLTASNSGILELFEDSRTCITCNPADARSLANKILWAKENPNLLEKIADNGYQLYCDYLRSSILAKNLLKKMQAL